VDFSLHVDMDCTWSNSAISFTAFVACMFVSTLVWRIVRSPRSMVVRATLAVVAVIVGEVLFRFGPDLWMRGALWSEDAPSIGDRFRHAGHPSLGCMTSDPWWVSPPLAIVVVAGIAALVAWKWPRR
jgi:hypothetical protein